MLRMGPTKPTLLLHPTRVRYGVLVFLCTLAMITYLDRVCISPVQEDIQSDLQIGSEQMGWIFTAFLIGYGLFEIPGGWMGDVWGSRVVLFRIVIWWSVFTALTGCVWAFPAAGLAFGIMVLVRFLFGAGEAVLSRTCPTLLACGFRMRSVASPRGPSGCRPGLEAPLLRL